MHAALVIINTRGNEIRTHDDRVKVGCLTTWLYPCIQIYNLLRATGIEPMSNRFTADRLTIQPYSLKRIVILNSFYGSDES